MIPDYFWKWLTTTLVIGGLFVFACFGTALYQYPKECTSGQLIRIDNLSGELFELKRDYKSIKTELDSIHKHRHRYYGGKPY